VPAAVAGGAGAGLGPDTFVAGQWREGKHVMAKID
jgi:hypothetical protein